MLVTRYDKMHAAGIINRAMLIAVAANTRGERQVWRPTRQVLVAIVARVVDETIDHRDRHRLVGEDLAPFTKRLVGGDQQ